MKEFLEQLKEIDKGFAMVETKGDSTIILGDCRRGLNNVIEAMNQAIQQEEKDIEDISKK